MQPLMTIGYEGATPEDFDATLEAHGVDIVVDVRAVAMSRRRGFAKTALSKRLTDRGIGYLHLRDLGDPKPGRDAARSGQWAEFRRVFSEHLKTAPAAAAVQSLSSLARQERVALLCYEAEPTECHRAMIADLLASDGKLVVAHLRTSASWTAAGGGQGKRNYPGEGRASP